jgi:Zn-dependent peptidase ImmA (M78 family)
MGLDDLPEVKLAKRIILKHNLSVPFDIENLIKEYAKLSFRKIPVNGVDGVSMHLKTPGKKAHIIVSSELPASRRLFTLAHELGHIVIPWHVGTIVDNVYDNFYNNYYYKMLEQEANRFAAELLMPKHWVMQNFKDLTLAELHKNIVHSVGVSSHAAAIRLIQLLQPNIIYTAEKNNIVLHSGSSALTKASTQSEGDIFDRRFYELVDEYSCFEAGAINYHWWKVSSVMNVEIDDDRSWREILTKICNDTVPLSQVKAFKLRLNGIMGSVNSSLKLNRNITQYTVESLTANLYYRLKQPEFTDFISHDDFKLFIKKRAEDYFKN